MVCVKSFVVVLLIGVALLVVEAMSIKTLPTLEEYIQAKRNKKSARTSRVFVAPPYIGDFYRYDNTVAESSVVNCHILQVGVHAFKTSGGVEYRRHEITELDCIDGSGTNLQQANFFLCAEAAAAADYNSFVFSDDVCKAYSIWRHRKIATCSNTAFAASDVAMMYIATQMITDYNPTALERFPVSVSNVFHGVGRIFLHWTAPDRCSMVARYQVISVSGIEERHGGLNEYHFNTFNTALCDDAVTDSDKTVTVVAYDFDGAEVLRFASTPETTGATRYVLDDGSCVLYDPAVALDQTSSTELCEGMSATLPTASRAMSFTEYKQMIAAVSEPIEDHFTGAIYSSNLNWEWAERCAPVEATEWERQDVPTNLTRGACSTSSSTDGFVLLQEDCDVSQSVVCHDAPYRVIEEDPSA